MKVKFSRKVTYIPEWNGNRNLPESERVTITLMPLKMGDLIKLMDTMQSASGGKVDEQSLTALEASNMPQVKELIMACGDLVPQYCEVHGLEDEGGAVTAETLVEYPYYMELSAELLSELGSISMPDEVEEKNSEPQQDTVPSTTQ